MENDIEQRACSGCKQNKYLSEFNGKWRVCKLCDYKRRKEKVVVARNFVIEYLKSHPCENCGEKDIVVLIFDHLRDKKNMISTLTRKGYCVETIKAEIEKCRVLCANCHSRFTGIQQHWEKSKE